MRSLTHEAKGVYVCCGRHVATQQQLCRHVHHGAKGSCADVCGVQLQHSAQAKVTDFAGEATRVAGTGL